jgi:hypothetical protein
LPSGNRILIFYRGISTAKLLIKREYTFVLVGLGLKEFIENYFSTLNECGVLGHLEVTTDLETLFGLDRRTGALGRALALNAFMFLLRGLVCWFYHLLNI